MSPSLGVVVPPSLPADQFVDYVRRADELGLAELWIVEDCFLAGGISQAAVALALTSTIRVGIGILPAGARNVAFASMEVATLAELFPDRLIVGIGHGMPSWMRQVGEWPASPLTLLREYLTAMRSILSGAAVSVEGRYVRLQDAQLGKPPRVVPPLLAGVRGPKSLALSGQVADGTILAEPVTPEYVAAVRRAIGPTAGDHQIVAYNVAAVDDNPARARDLARSSLEWIGEPDWMPHIAPLPFAEDFARLRSAAGSRAEFAASLPDEWVEQLAVVGTPADARARVDALAVAGVDSLIFIPAGPDPIAAMTALAQVL
jgi:5,10-methylenetetrahydromethanopterin reductase